MAQDTAYGVLPQDDDWFAQNAPSTIDMQSGDDGIFRSADPTSFAEAARRGGVVGPSRSGMTGYQSGQGGDFNSLVNQWQDSHPPNNPDMDGLIQFLAQHGIQAQRATHGVNGSQISEDKLVYNGGMYDIGSSLGASDGSWFKNFGADTGGGSNAGPYQNPSFDQTFTFPTWDKQFVAPTLEQAKQEPGYAFTQQEGEKGILRNAAKMGIARTGGTLKDIDQFNTGLADQTYSHVYNRAAGEYNQQLQKRSGNSSPSPIWD
jgi:hypothetical protein